MRIGIFDSGFGGLTIFRHIRDLLPEYDYLYLGDNARAPYGTRSFRTVVDFTIQAIQWLWQQECSLIVIACNTASARALRTIQQQVLPIHHPGWRVLGIIRPSIESLNEATVSGRVALWATQGTVASRSFELEARKLHPHLRLSPLACPMLVPLVEAGELEGEGVEYFLRRYWNLTLEMAPDADSLLLGCTHYPLLIPSLSRFMPPGVRILSQGPMVAESLARYLRHHPEQQSGLSRGAGLDVVTTEDPEHFDRLATAYLGLPVKSRRIAL